MSEITPDGIAQQPPQPINIDVYTTLTADSIVGATYRQTSEDDYTSRPVTLLDLIVESAARQLVDGIKRDRDGYSSIRKLVEQRMAEMVDARIAPMLDEAIAKPLVQTNGYGEPTGTTTSLTELVIAAARQQMTVRHNRDGFHREAKTALEHALADVTEQALAKELRAEVDAAKAEVRKAVQTVTSEHLGAQLARQLGVAP